jgi:hypothetical protein
MDRAVKKAVKNPKISETDFLASYQDVTYGDGAEHRQASPFSKEDNTSPIESWYSTLKQRTKVVSGLEKFETAISFTESYLGYYNYPRPHEASGNKIPEEYSGINPLQ